MNAGTSDGKIINRFHIRNPGLVNENCNKLINPNYHDLNGSACY
jgi:hypothetical protein